MKKWILLLLSMNVHADHSIYHNDKPSIIMPIIEVVDGDTIRSVLTLPEPLNKISVRMNGIDAPEPTWRAKCDKERKLGNESKSFMIDYLKDKKIMIVQNFFYGTYAGRIIGDIIVDDINLAQLLLNKGYAKPYDGKNKPNWCE